MDEKIPAQEWARCHSQPPMWPTCEASSKGKKNPFLTVPSHPLHVPSSTRATSARCWRGTRKKGRRGLKGDEIVPAQNWLGHPCQAPTWPTGSCSKPPRKARKKKPRTVPSRSPHAPRSTRAHWCPASEGGKEGRHERPHVAHGRPRDPTHSHQQNKSKPTSI